jgi:polyisoprenoid-binding protein YceI
MTRFETLRHQSEITLEADSGMHPIQVKTNRVQGYLEAALDENGKFDFSKPAVGQLEVDVSDLKSGNALLDKAMSGHVDTRRYPTILAEVIKIYDGNGSYHAVGDITFHGVTHRMEDMLVIERLDDNTLSVRGEIVVDVRDFNLSPPKLLFMKVEPQVRIRLASVIEQVE